METKFDQTPLTEKGYVFLDQNKRPYLIRMWEDTPWVFYWHPDKRWASLRKTNQTEIWQTYPHRLPEDQAEHYHQLSERDNNFQAMFQQQIDPEALQRQEAAYNALKEYDDEANRLEVLGRIREVNSRFMQTFADKHHTTIAEMKQQWRNLKPDQYKP